MVWLNVKHHYRIQLLKFIEETRKCINLKKKLENVQRRECNRR